MRWSTSTQQKSDKTEIPFPIIENCLLHLGNKSIFTLFDLKNGFHQIKIHPDHILNIFHLWPKWSIQTL